MKRNVTRSALRAAIERQSDLVIDFDLAVDAARTRLDSEVQEFRGVVLERSRAEEHLAHLIELAGHSEPVRPTFGHIAQVSDADGGLVPAG
jgi:hypothetical protein